jgi:hypothetical protein
VAGVDRYLLFDGVDSMTKDEALRLALEALEWMVANDDTNEGDEPVERLGGQSWNEYNAYWLDGLNKARASITAIKQALAAPVQPCNPAEDGVCEALECCKQPAPVQDTEAHYKGVVEGVKKLFDDKRAQPAVPDAFGTREGEHPQYVQGWNDCRQTMLEILKARGNT